MLSPDFLTYPVIWIDINDCVWPDHNLDKDHLGEPERRRDNDDEPILVEQLITGHWFVHDGRHRLLRSRARGEHQVKAHALTKAIQRAAWERKERQWNETQELIGG